MMKSLSRGLGHGQPTYFAPTVPMRKNLGEAGIMAGCRRVGYTASVNDALARLSEHPILLAVFVFLLGGLAFFILRKLLKLAMIFLLGALAVAGWYLYTGEEPPEAMKQAVEQAGEKLKRGAELTKEKARELGERIGQGVERTAEERMEKEAEERLDPSRQR